MVMVISVYIIVNSFDKAIDPFALHLAKKCTEWEIHSMDSKNQNSAINQAEAYGIDVSLIDDNLEKTPTERLTLHQLSLERVQALQEAWKHEQSKRNSETSSAK